MRAGAALGCLLAGIAATGCRAPEPAKLDEGSEVEEIRVEGATADTLRLPRAELEVARRTASALGQDLAGLVFSTLEEEGAAAAVGVCATVAQERTAMHGGEGIYVRRVSDRLRNPLNEPDPAERREIDRLRELDAAGAEPQEIIRVVRFGESRSLHLVRPIRIQPPCLACHGAPEEIAPDVRAILAELYPADRATGYTAGQLRGAISVRVPVE